MRIKYIKQNDQSDCGPTCLAMLSQYYGKKTMISRIREWSKTDKEGTTLYGLIKGGKSLGIELTGVKAEKANDIDKSDLPMIAHIMNEQGYMHFIIIEKKTQKNFHIIDPAKGKEKINFTEFEKKWTGILMLVQNDASYGYDDNIPSKSKVFIEILKTNKVSIINIFSYQYL